MTSESPRTVTLHGKADSLIPYYLSVSLHEKLDEMGVENSLIGIEGFDHALDMGYSSVGAQIFRWTLAKMMEGEDIFGEGGGRGGTDVVGVFASSFVFLFVGGCLVWRYL